jgi:WD40 repeat protein
LLQFALTRIWEGLASGKEPAETLKNIGGVGGALAGEAQRIYDSLSSVEQKDIARRVFLGLVQLGEGSKDTRRRTEINKVVSQRDTPEQVKQVIARFSAPGARLITLAANANVETAEVTHEALFEHWRQLNEWLDSSRSDIRFQRRLDEAAVHWNKHSRPEGNLWRPPDLDLLRRYHQRASDDMTSLQVEFFNASIDAENARKQAAEKAEKERKQQRQRLVRVLSTGLVLTTSLTLFAVVQLQQVQRKRVEQLAATAKAQLSSQPVEAQVNAIAAFGLNQSAFVKFPNYPLSASVEGSLLDVIRVNKEQNQWQHTSAVRSAVYSPDGQKIVSGSGDNTVRRWDAATGKPLGQPLTGHTGWVWSVTYSPDGQKIVSGSWDKTVRRWDAATDLPFGQPLIGHTGRVESVVYSPKDKQIVSGSEDKTVRRWDAATGKPLGQPLIGHTGSVRSVAYSPNSKQIVSGSTDNTVRRWDALTGKPLGQPLIGHTGPVWSVVYSPDGRQIVSGSKDNTVRRWDAATGKPLGQSLTGHTGWVWSVAYSPDGKQIVSGSYDKTVRLWDAATGKTLSLPLTEHTEVVYSVAFSPDGKRLVSGSYDNTVRLWDVSWESLLQTACEQLQHHSILDKSAIGVAKEARETCQQYVWH